jgi:arsenite methyltransferase
MSHILEADAVRKDVEKFYAEKIQSKAAQTDCCSPSDCDCAGSSVDFLENIPSTISSTSLGCSNPISAANLQPGEIVVDLGSGAGLDCFLAAREIGPTGKVIGIDMTSEMLERARSNADQLNVKNVEFREGLIENMPLEDGSADVLISNCVINLSPEKSAVFAEIQRVLRPGGRIVIGDIVSNGTLLPKFQEAEAGWECCISGAMTVDDYHKALAQAGFNQIEIQPVEGFDIAQPKTGHPFSAMITAIKPLH